MKNIARKAIEWEPQTESPLKTMKPLTLNAMTQKKEPTTEELRDITDQSSIVAWGLIIAVFEQEDEVVQRIWTSLRGRLIDLDGDEIYDAALKTVCAVCDSLNQDKGMMDFYRAGSRAGRAEECFTRTDLLDTRHRDIALLFIKETDKGDDSVIKSLERILEVMESELSEESPDKAFEPGDIELLIFDLNIIIRSLRFLHKNAVVCPLTYGGED